MWSHSGSRTQTYTLSKRDYIFEEYLSSMADYQLRKTLSRFRCGSHWLRCATRFLSPDPTEMSCPACLEGRVCGVQETEHHFIFDCDAYHDIRRNLKFRPLFAASQPETLRAFYQNDDYPLIAKFLLHCRRERTKVITYYRLEIRKGTSDAL